MYIKPTLLLIFTALTFSSFGQVSIASNINIYTDSTTKTQILNSLNGFLAQKEKPNKENSYVQKEDLLSMSILLDEIKGIEKSGKFKNNNFYKGYVTDLMVLNANEYLVGLSYIGVNDTLPLLRASFELVAQKVNDVFYFHSVLKQNTVLWKSEKMGSTQFYYKTTFNASNAKKYLKKVDEYDKRLNATDQPTAFYCCDNYHDVLQMIGVDYKSDYSGYSHNTLTSHENGNNLVVDGTTTSDFTTFDPHDLWHDRLHRVLSTEIINRPVDEGCAYLYGGSWGISWDDVLQKFKAYAAANPNADWVSLYNDNKDFAGIQGKPITACYAINALLVQKIEKEKGFSAVIELLSCGKKEVGNENYFKALQKITGIDKANFNANVWMLIKGS
jgi:hypothetical protein